MAQRLDFTKPGFEERFRALVGMKREAAADIEAVVDAILRDVAQRGDEALIEYSRRFDKLELLPSTLRVSEGEIEAAVAQCPREALDALAFAKERIEAFHARQRPTDDHFTDALGVRLGLRWTPIEAVGLYVPGGTASYPSSVPMNAVPAKVAGVERIVMVAPTPEGRQNPLVLAAAKLAGIDEIWRIGGAQAIAALAYGTASIAPVAKIVGPGNAYVAQAKRRVFGLVGIDSIAGPSEVLVLADKSADPDWVALDLLAQAEHDASSQSILITDDAALADAVENRIALNLALVAARRDRASELARLRRRDPRAVADASVALVDRLAPEHLEIATGAPEKLAGLVRNAGAIFLGHHTPEAIGDYVGGPNHVLPRRAPRASPPASASSIS